MAFSVLMSLYYKENPESLRQSLESVFNQTLIPDEVVLVLDGPITDKLTKVVDEFCGRFKQLKIVPLKLNMGLGKALNEGLKHCSNDLVVRMDTDDICFPNRFEKQVAFMNIHTDISACSSWIDEFIDTPDNVASVKTLPETSKELFEYGKSRCPINHPAVVYRKKDVIDAGGYGPFPEDYYLWSRMMMKGYMLYNIQESLLWFRSSKDVYKRRGGWNYCKAMFALQNDMRRIGYLSTFQFVKNCLVRCTVSILPNWVRSLFYKSFLRKSLDTNNVTK